MQAIEVRSKPPARNISYVHTRRYFHRFQSKPCNAASRLPHQHQEQTTARHGFTTSLFTHSSSSPTLSTSTHPLPTTTSPPTCHHPTRSSSKAGFAPSTKGKRK